MDRYDNPGERGRADSPSESREDYSAYSQAPEQRARLRAQRARKRAARRRRLWALASLVVVALIALGITAGVVVSRSGSRTAPGPPPRTPRRVATAAPVSPPGTTVASSPASTAPTTALAGSPASTTKPSGGKSYFWVSFQAPKPVEKVSDTTHPTVAIVVDDTGNILEPMPKWLAIDAPLTFSVLPYPPLSKEIAFRMQQAGYAIMMHIPTQNAPPNSFAGKGQLSVGMDQATVFRTLDADLATVPFVKGINNHEGGLGCDNLDLMTNMCKWAEPKGLFVVDSSSSNHDKVTIACKALGLPVRKNEVFIDHQNDPNYIRNAMNELAGLARKNGTAIGICHWHRPNTPTTVGEMVLKLRSEGIHFAFARDVTD